MKRFTIDGGDALEIHLAQTCERVAAGVAEIIPAGKLEAVVLGGGYGRGEGGVLKTGSSEDPYNDLEFYVFVRGNRLVNERAYRAPLETLSTGLTPVAGVHVEFKVDSINRLRHSPVSMFTYDLVSGHKVIVGDENIFAGCDKHLDASKIPLHEATRLLFNRCTGLLFAKNFLYIGMDVEKADFVGRNLAKAQLALGDVVLAMHGQYHWSVCERVQRLKDLNVSGLPVPADELHRHHLTGAHFKLYPQRISKSADAFCNEHDEISSCARKLWLWLETRRLKQPFVNVRDYSMSPVNKCPETSSLKNLLINLRIFGPKVISFRYPRERLLQALPLMLWKADALGERRFLFFLQSELRTEATAQPELVTAYEKIWRRFN